MIKSKTNLKLGVLIRYNDTVMAPLHVMLHCYAYELYLVLLQCNIFTIHYQNSESLK